MKKPRTEAARQFKAKSEKIIEQLIFFTKTKKTIQPLTNTLLGGIIAKTYAEFENYIFDSITELVLYLSTYNIPFQALPLEVRSTLISKKINHTHFKNYYATDNEMQFLENIEHGYNGGVFCWDRTASYVIRATDIIQNKNYPSDKNIHIVYKRLGIANIFQEMDKELKRDSRKIITSYNAIRCGFVHDSVDPTIDEQDIKKNIHDLTCLIMVLDKIAYTHVTNIKRNN